MAVGAAANQIVKIFNDLVTTSPAEVEAIAQAEWRLRVLARSRRGDTAVGVALLLASLMLGKGADSIAQANYLWPLRHAMGPDQLGTFFIELMHLGIYDRIKLLLQEIKGQPVERAIPSLLDVYVQTAWGTGDVDLMDAVLEDPAASDLISRWKNFLNDLKSQGFAPHLAGRQQIVQELTFGRRCFSHPSSPLRRGA